MMGYGSQGLADRARWLVMMMAALALVSLMPVALATGNARAESDKTVAASSHITRVTVFPKGAEITRIVRLDLEAGPQAVVLKDVTAQARSDTIRVEAVTTQGKLLIGAVDSKVVYVTIGEQNAVDQSERRRIEDEIQTLQDSRAELNNRIVAANLQAGFIRRLAQPPVFFRNKTKGKIMPPPGPAPAVPALKPDEVGQMFFIIGSSMNKALAIRQKLLLERRALDRRIKELRQKLASQPVRQETRKRIVVNVTATGKVKGTLTLRYMVSNAWWRPFYDARLDTGIAGTGAADKPAKRALSLTRRAAISQRTGESWEDVVLTLSTSQPERGTAAPDLPPLKVSIYTPPPPAPARSEGKMRKKYQPSPGQYPMQQRRMFDQMAAEKPAMPAMMAKPAAEADARISAGAFQAVYAIPGKVSVKTTGEGKNVLIAQDRFEPELLVRTVPSQRKTAFLYAKFKLAGATDYLPGKVSLYRDGIYVGTGRLPQLTQGESHELGFGVDVKVKVEFARLKRKKGEIGGVFTASANMDERRYKITVENLHRQPVTIIVLDRMPYTEDDVIKIALTSDSARPDKVNVKDRRGLVEWRFKLAPQAKKEIRFGYTITWPKKQQIRFR